MFKKFLKMFTVHGIGTKLEGIRSLSTSPLLNPLCIARHKNPAFICFKCYSYTYNKMRRGLREKLERNTKYLTESIIPLEEIPVINDRYFRIESFGDLQNMIQAINYLNFILKNPETQFGWWTKNPAFIKKALEHLGIERPQNVQIVFSSCCINQAVSLETVQRVYPFITKVFTVYDKKTIEKEGIAINCGGRHCLDCLNCYLASGDSVMNEKLK